MPTYDKEKIKKQLYKKYKAKFKPDILNKHIDGLVEEYIENDNFIKKNKLKVKNLPTKSEINSWFEDELEANELLENLNDPIAKIDLYAIYHKDKLAKEVYKNFYKYKWKRGDEIPIPLKTMIQLLKIAETTKNVQNKNTIISRLINIALLGTVRFYHLERKPYFKEKQIQKIINYFIGILTLIYKIEHKKFKDVILDEEVYIFKTLDENSK